MLESEEDAPQPPPGCRRPSSSPQQKRLSVVLTTQSSDHWAKMLGEMVDEEFEREHRHAKAGAGGARQAMTQLVGPTGAAVTNELAAEALRIARRGTSYVPPPEVEPPRCAVMLPPGPHVSHLLRRNGHRL